MMKTDKELEEPSLKGGVLRKFSKKVIILFITIVIGLTTLLMPSSISSFTGTSSYVNANSLDNTNKAKTYIDNIINEYLEQMKDKGYVNISYEVNPIVKAARANHIMRVSLPAKFTEEEIKKNILKDFIFYAEYVTLSEGETVYVFKTAEESENFIVEVNKYEKANFHREEKVKRVLGEETSKETLDSAIADKKAQAEKRAAEEAARKREAARKAAQKEAAMKQVVVETDAQGGVSDSEIVNYALQFNGNPYVYGGTSLTNGADCSGFVQSIYKHFGYNIPRTARAQASAGRAVSFNNLQPGDLVFYSGDGGASITHVAMYIGGGKIIHAQTPAKGIGITSVNIMIKMSARRII